MRQSLIHLIVLLLPVIGWGANLSDLNQKVLHLFQTLNGPSLVSELRSLKSHSSPMALQLINQSILELSKTMGRPEALAAGPQLNELSDSQLCDPSLLWMMKLAYVDFDHTKKNDDFMTRLQTQIEKYQGLEERALSKIEGDIRKSIPRSDRRSDIAYKGAVTQFEREAQTSQEHLSKKMALAAKYTLAASAPKPMADLMGITAFQQGVAERAAATIKTRDIPALQNEKLIADENLKQFKLAQNNREILRTCKYASEIALTPREEIASGKAKGKRSAHYVLDQIGDGYKTSRKSHPHLYSEYWDTNTKMALYSEDAILRTADKGPAPANRTPRAPASARSSTLN